MKKLQPILLCLTVLFLLLVHSPGSAQQSKPGVLFLNFHVTGGQNNETKIELTNFRVAEGELNEFRSKPQYLTGSRLRCILSNAQGEILFETEVSDPLVRDYEYADENGNLRHSTITSETGDFSLRIPNSKDYKQIRFERISQEKITELQSLTLNLD